MSDSDLGKKVIVTLEFCEVDIQVTCFCASHLASLNMSFSKLLYFLFHRGKNLNQSNNELTIKKNIPFDKYKL